MTRFILRFLNGLITFAVVIVLGLSTAYAVYSLWDNQQVYDAVENTMDEMREIRAQIDTPKSQKGIEALIASAATATNEPDLTPPPAEVLIIPTEASVTGAEGITEEAQSAESAESGSITDAETQTDNAEVTATEAAANVSAEVPAEAPMEEPADDTPFGKLKAINPDITAWITMPGTAIDYPVLQGSSNYTYINTDVYGEFALAGSIFLDYRNDRNYEDNYSLLYGHDMSKHRMFSDVNLYKDEEFFIENHLGILLTPDGNHLLQSIACVVTSAGNSSLFNPENWKEFTPEQILEVVQNDAVQISQEGLEALEKRLDEGEPFHVVALSTCSDEFTDARTILLTLMDP